MSISPQAYEAVAELYHNWFTGLMLFVATRKDAKAAGDLSFALFRRQHHAKFLSSFDKLGLSDLPHAVACAQYHYLSNGVGGVGVEFMPESDRKAWVRFRHPRWMYEGPALAGMPLEVSHGFLRGWYGHNGVSLGNPRLGFVCTSQDMTGQYGLAGYFYEYDHDLTPEDRLRFAPGEIAPPFDPAKAPTLAGEDWPEERLQKANRNYAMTYLGNALPEMVGLWGPLEAAWLASGSAEIIGRQLYAETADRLGITEGGVENFAKFMVAIGDASGDEVTLTMEEDSAIVSQKGWRLMREENNPHPAIFDGWNGLWRGLLAAHDRTCVIEVLNRQDYGDPETRWRIRKVF